MSTSSSFTNASLTLLCLLISAPACVDEDKSDDGLSSVTTDSPLTRSGTRIQARVGLTEDGSSELLGWHDAEFDTACVFMKDEKGDSRCLPVAPPAEYFSDANCRIPIVALDVCPPPSFVVINQRIPSCDTPTHTQVHEVTTDAFSGPVFRWTEGTGCRSATATFAFKTTRKVAPDLFARRTEAIVKP